MQYIVHGVKDAFESFNDDSSSLCGLLQEAKWLLGIYLFQGGIILKAKLSALPVATFPPEINSVMRFR